MFLEQGKEFVDFLSTVAHANDGLFFSVLCNLLLRAHFGKCLCARACV